MIRLSLAFFGAPIFSARVLEQIIKDTDLPVKLKFVVTQPDRKAGRKQILTPTPVKLLAQKHNISVFDTFKPSNLQTFKLEDTDLVLLYAFGEILPLEMLKIPKWGFWNIHPSLLPKYRGTSPIAYSLLMGDKTTGVSLIQMDKRMDHGPIIAQEEYDIQNEDTREDLENKLSDIGYKLFKKSVQDVINGALERRTQNEEQRTFTRLLTKQDGFLPYPLVQTILRGEPFENEQLPPIITEYYTKNHIPPSSTFNFKTFRLFDLFRAFGAWPGLWTLLPINGVEKRLKITGVEYKDEILSITKVQLEGKKEVDISTFLSAYPIS